MHHSLFDWRSPEKREDPPQWISSSPRSPRGTESAGRSSGAAISISRKPACPRDLRTYLAAANHRRGPDPRIRRATRQRNRIDCWDRTLPLSCPRLDDEKGLLSPGPVRRQRRSPQWLRPPADRRGRRRGTRARLLPAVLGDVGGQRHRAIALRPDRPIQRLHPLRLRAGVNGPKILLLRCDSIRVGLFSRDPLPCRE
jgi:hypothetical protein